MEKGKKSHNGRSTRFSRRKVCAWLGRKPSRLSGAERDNVGNKAL